MVTDLSNVKILGLVLIPIPRHDDSITVIVTRKLISSSGIYLSFLVAKLEMRVRKDQSILLSLIGTMTTLLSLMLGENTMGYFSNLSTLVKVNI